MKELKINGSKIEFKNQLGDTIRGEYYIKDNKIYFKAQTAYDLSVILRNKKEIIKLI